MSSGRVLRLCCLLVSCSSHAAKSNKATVQQYFVAEFGIILGRRSANCKAIKPHGWLSDADWDALTVLTAGAHARV